MSAAIRGYASVFNQEFRPDGPTAMLVRPGAFVLDRAVPLWVDHDGRDVLASTADHLRVWQDREGLAFEIDVATDLLDRLARDVANGRRAAVSACYAAGRTSHFEMIGGERVEVVSRTRVDEISLLSCGACPGAQAWLAIGGQDRAPWELRNISARWNLGRMQNSVANHHHRHRASRKPSMPASVAALLDSAAFQRGRAAQHQALRERAAQEQPRSAGRPPDSLVMLMASPAFLAMRPISNSISMWAHDPTSRGGGCLHCGRRPKHFE